jgi:hypothetical protein
MGSFGGSERPLVFSVRTRRALGTGRHRRQSSSVSRFTAGAFGFLNLKRQEAIGHDDERLCLLADELCEGGIDVGLGAGGNDLQPEADAAVATATSGMSCTAPAVFGLTSIWMTVTLARSRAAFRSVSAPARRRSCRCR